MRVYELTKRAQCLRKRNKKINANGNAHVCQFSRQAAVIALAAMHLDASVDQTALAHALVALTGAQKKLISIYVTRLDVKA